MIDIFDKTKVASMIQKAKADSDCLIFVAQWGREEESMPREYEKRWAAFLMQQGVDVVIGGHPHVLQPYGRMSDDEGNEMLIFYSLGNFVSTQEGLSNLLGGMASFTIQKSVLKGKTEIQILNPVIKPTVMHYNKDEEIFGPYMLEDYTEELASQHGVLNIDRDEFSLENLKKKFNEIMSMNVEPSTRTDLLDVSFAFLLSLPYNIHGSGCFPRSSSKSTAHFCIGSGWHIGISEEVCFTPIIPATLATPRTSPFFDTPPLCDSCHNLRPHSNIPGCCSIRKVGALFETSTITAFPFLSKWLNSFPILSPPYTSL